jgi:hypothetical protein
MAIITVPTDSIRVNQLRTKLAEYNDRVSDDPSCNDSRYKAYLLSKLLKDGVVDTQQLSMAILREEGGLDMPIFVNACIVIEDYVLTGGQEVFFGTGLRPVDQISLG